MIPPIQVPSLLPEWQNLQMASSLFLVSSDSHRAKSIHHSCTWLKRIPKKKKGEIKKCNIWKKIYLVFLLPFANGCSTLNIEILQIRWVESTTLSRNKSKSLKTPCIDQKRVKWDKTRLCGFSFFFSPPQYAKKQYLLHLPHRRNSRPTLCREIWHFVSRTNVSCRRM